MFLYGKGGFNTEAHCAENFGGGSALTGDKYMTPSSQLLSQAKVMEEGWEDCKKHWRMIQRIAPLKADRK